MKPLFSIIIAVLLIASVRAQQLDNPVTVPLSFYGEGVVNAGYSYFTIGASLGAGASASQSGLSYGASFYSSPITTVNVIPGKEYSVTATSTGCMLVYAHFRPTDGYEVYIMGIRQTSITMGGNFNFTLRVERKMEALERGLLGKRGGEATSFPEDKPIWYIGLGSLRNGQPAGQVGIRANTITSALFNTSSLIYESADPSEVSVTRSGAGHITQIQARDVVLQMDPYNASGTSYSIRAYVPTNLTTPFITYTISSYSGGGGTGIRIDKVENGVTWSTALSWSSPTWTLIDWQKVPSGASPLSTTNAITTGVSGSTHTVTYGSGSGIKVKEKIYSGGELVSEKWGAGITAPPTTTYSYYTSASGSGWPSALNTVVEPTGNWTKYEYYNGGTDTRAGQIARIFRPWLDAPTSPGSATTANCLLESYDYTTNYDGTQTARQLREVRANNTLIGKTTWAYNWTHGTINSRPVYRMEQRDYSSSGSYLTTVTLAMRPDDTFSFYRDRPMSVTRPDGTKDSYAYLLGTWNPSTYSFAPGSGSDRAIIAFHGQSSAGTAGVAMSSWGAWTMDTVYVVPNVSMATETIIDTHGRVVFTAKNIVTSASTMERIDAQARTYNGNNLLTVEKDVIRSVSGGDVSVTYGYNAGLLTSKTDIAGTQTSYGYNDYLLNTSITTGVGGAGAYPAKTQSFTYYSSGLKWTSQNCDCSPTVTTYSYENSGRIASTSEPKPGGGTLTTIYSYPNSRQTQITLPTGATKITDLYYDGRVKSETGTGQVATYYDYDRDSSYLYRTTKVGSTGTNGWVEEKTDWLGRVVTLRTPQVGWTSGSNKVTRKTHTYSLTTGQLTKVSTTDESASSVRLLPDHLYIYGDLGRLVREGDDHNSNGVLDTGGTDRITYYTHFFYKDPIFPGGYNSWIQVDEVRAYRTLNNSGDVSLVSKVHTRHTNRNNGGLLSGARVIFDRVALDASGRQKVEWEWVDPSTKLRTAYRTEQGASQAGYTYWENGYLKSEQSISGVTRTHTYNGQGLLASTTESTTNAATTYGYHSGTSYVSSVTQTTGSSATATTNYTYTWGTGSNAVKTTDAAGNSAYTEYNALGQPWRTWGTAVQPSLYGYDGYGRRTTLTTWQSGTFTGSTWPGSPPAGNTTTWNLDPATGSVISKVYPNSSSVAFTYNGRGQMKKRTWARGVETNYNYYDNGVSPFTGELKQITYTDGTPTVDYTYTRFGAMATVSDAAGSRTINYGTDLKPTSEVFGAYYGSKTLTFNYDVSVPGRPTGYSFNGSSTVTATFGYSSSTGRPNSIAGALGGTSATFSIGYASGTDWANSITSGSYTRTLPLVSKYDVIASATTTWGGTTLGSFSAAYADSRGWRSGQTINAASYATSLGLGSGGTATFGYDGYGRLTSSTSTISGRTRGWTYDLAGNRQTETGGGTTTYSTANTNPNAHGSLDQYESITGTNAESTLAYDADGNLTQDGTWTYAYDGENRLKSMTKSGQTLTFTYDHMNRRIRKTLVASGTTTLDVKFLWTGWKLAAELASNGSTVNQVFVWGPDFSDAQGNAGGAGSLLAQIGSGGVSYAVPDALGNIVGYANSSGTIVAAVEYSAYGRPVSTSGSYTSYPIGYSGQYTDWETGLVYYGMRYYTPKHGRFVNRDPIEERGGNNLYAFTQNRPTRAWDILGLCTFEPDKSGRMVLTCPKSSNSGEWLGFYYQGDLLEHSLNNWFTRWKEQLAVAINGSRTAPEEKAPNKTEKEWKPNKADCGALRSTYASEIGAVPQETRFTNITAAINAAAVQMAMAPGAQFWEYGSFVLRNNEGYFMIANRFTNKNESAVSLASSYDYSKAYGDWRNVAVMMHSHPPSNPVGNEVFSFQDQAIAGRRAAVLLTPSFDLRTYSQAVDGPPNTVTEAANPGRHLNGAIPAADLGRLQQCAQAGY